MNQRLYEGRFLVSVVGAVIRQDEFRVKHSRMDWERVYRLADSHRVSPILYLGILGSWEPVPARWKEALFERYIETLHCNDIFDDAVREIFAAMDMNQIPCTVLSRGREKKFYPIPEMGGSCVLRLFVSEEQYIQVKGYLVDLGYETEYSLKNIGERMHRVSGLRVELYRKMPFRSAFYRKTAAKLLDGSQEMEGYQMVKELTQENEFLFRMVRAAYHYVTDELTLLEMLDLYYSHRDCRESISQESMSAQLAAFHAADLAERLLSIAYLWFGGKDEAVYAQEFEPSELRDVMENRILTRGLIRAPQGQEHSQAEELSAAIAREIDQENREEERRLRREAWQKRWRHWKKKAAWVFPGISYMKSIYPILSRMPFLLPIFWAARGGRLLTAGREKERD